MENNQFKLILTIKKVIIYYIFSYNENCHIYKE